MTNFKIGMSSYIGKPWKYIMNKTLRSIIFSEKIIVNPLRLSKN